MRTAVVMTHQNEFCDEQTNTSKGVSFVPDMGKSGPIISSFLDEGDDDNDSTSGLSALLDEVLSPSFTPENNNNNNRNEEKLNLPCDIKGLHRESSRCKSRNGGRGSSRKRVELATKSDVDADIKRSEAKMESKTKKGNECGQSEKEDMRKKWRTVSRQMKQRSKRDLLRRQAMIGKSKQERKAGTAIVPIINKASFLEWILSMQKGMDDGDTVSTPRLSNESKRNLTEDVDPNDIKMIVRSLAPLAKSPNSSKSLEAFLLAIQEEQSTKNEVHIKAHSATSDNSNVSHI